MAPITLPASGTYLVHAIINVTSAAADTIACRISDGHVDLDSQIAVLTPSGSALVTLETPGAFAVGTVLDITCSASGGATDGTATLAVATVTQVTG
jgi:hypothetical protein